MTSTAASRRARRYATNSYGVYRNARSCGATAADAYAMARAAGAPDSTGNVREAAYEYATTGDGPFPVMVVMAASAKVPGGYYA